MKEVTAKRISVQLVKFAALICLKTSLNNDLRLL